MWNPSSFIQWQRYCTVCRQVEAWLTILHSTLAIMEMPEWPDYEYVGRFYGGE